MVGGLATPGESREPGERVCISLVGGRASQQPRPWPGLRPPRSSPTTCCKLLNLLASVFSSLKRESQQLWLLIVYV